MCLNTKLALPLIDDNLLKDDLSEKAGFVDAFTQDINRPFLNNHLFLMYSYNNTKESVTRYCKFLKLPTLYKYYHVKIDKIMYIVYCFIKHPERKKDINNILKGSQYFISNSSKFNISSFYTEYDITLCLYNQHWNYIGENIDILPEEDLYINKNSPVGDESTELLETNKKGQLLDTRNCPLVIV